MAELTNESDEELTVRLTGDLPAAKGSVVATWTMNKLVAFMQHCRDEFSVPFCSGGRESSLRFINQLLTKVSATIPSGEQASVEINLAMSLVSGLMQDEPIQSPPSAESAPSMDALFYGSDAHLLPDTPPSESATIPALDLLRRVSSEVGVYELGSDLFDAINACLNREATGGKP